MFGKSFPPQEPTIQRAVNPKPTRRSYASRSSDGSLIWYVPCDPTLPRSRLRV